SQIDAGLRWHRFCRLAGAARGGHDPGHTGLCNWTAHRGKRLAAGVGTHRCLGTCTGAGSFVLYVVADSNRKFPEGLERYLAAVDPSARGGGSAGRVSCTAFGTGENVSLPDLSRPGVLAVLGAVRLAFSLSS